MEQKDRLIEDPDKLEKAEQIASQLIAPTTDQQDLDHIDEELRQEDFASLEEYLAAKEQRKTCRTANAAVVPSLPTSGPVADGTNGSNASTGAADVIDVRRQWASRPDYILNGLKTEPLAHPIPDAPNVELTAEGAAISEAVEYETKLEIHNHPLVGSYVVETQQVVEKGDWWKETFLGGRHWALEAQPIESIVAKIHELDDAIKKIKAFQQGTRSGLEDRLKGATTAERAKLRDADKKYRSPKKTETSDAPKTRKAKEPTARSSEAGKTKGMKVADALGGGMGYTNAEILEKLRSTHMLDEATEIYVNAKYPA